MHEACQISKHYPKAYGLYRCFTHKNVLTCLLTICNNINSFAAIGEGRGRRLLSTTTLNAAGEFVFFHTKYKPLYKRIYIAWSARKSICTDRTFVVDVRTLQHNILYIDYIVLKPWLKLKTTFLIILTLKRWSWIFKLPINALYIDTISLALLLYLYFHCY